MRTFCMFLVTSIVLVSVPVVAQAESQQRTLVNRLLFSKSARFGGLEDVEENSTFFNHRVTDGNLEAIKSVVGAKEFDSLRLEDLRGKSLRDILDFASSKSLLQKHPYILTALTQDAIKNDNVQLRLHEDDGGEKGENIEISDPARTIPAEDIYEHTSGPNAGTRNFRRYLQRTYGLENKPPMKRPDEIEAFSVFNNFASGLSRGDIDENGEDNGEPGLPDSNDPSKRFGYLQDHFVQDARHNRNAQRPDEDTPGMFLPSKETLQTIKTLLTLQRELKFAKDESRKPDLSGLDEDAIKALLAEAGLSDKSELEGMSADDVRRYMSRLVAKEVKRELDENDYVYEMSSVAHAGGTDPVGAAGGEEQTAAYSGVVQPTFTIGNETAGAELNDVAEQLSRQDLTEAERTKLELDNLGGFHVIGDIEKMGAGSKTGTFLGPNMTDGYLNLQERPRE